MIDKPMVIYEYLSQIGTDLYGEVATRIWNGKAPSSWENENAALVFWISGGNSKYSGATNRATVNFRCYGGNSQPGNEITVFKYLFDLLNGRSAETISGKIVSAQLVSESQLPPEPDSTFKSYLATFAIVFADA